MDFDRKLKELIANTATEDVDPDTINAETVLFSDLGYDSVQIIELIVGLENEFNIEIEDDDLEIENLSVYSKLYNMVIKKLSNDNPK